LIRTRREDSFTPRCINSFTFHRLKPAPAKND
jgi:hypothetical protein